MSHIVQIQTEIRDPVALRHACARMALPMPMWCTVELFNANAVGWAVQLPDWTYPVVCDTDSGQLHYDNFGGRWGDQCHLDRFVQLYSVEKARLEARKKGFLALEQLLADGSIKVTIQTGA